MRLIRGEGEGNWNIYALEAQYEKYGFKKAVLRRKFLKAIESEADFFAARYVLTAGLSVDAIKDFHRSEGTVFAYPDYTSEERVKVIEAAERPDTPIESFPGKSKRFLELLDKVSATPSRIISTHFP